MFQPMEAEFPSAPLTPSGLVIFIALRPEPMPVTVLKFVPAPV